MSLTLIEAAIEKIAYESTDEGIRDLIYSQNKEERKKAWGRLGTKSKHSVPLTTVAGGLAGGVGGALLGAERGHGGKGALIGAGVGAGAGALHSWLRNKGIDYAREKAK